MVRTLGETEKEDNLANKNCLASGYCSLGLVLGMVWRESLEEGDNNSIPYVRPHSDLGMDRLI